MGEVFDIELVTSGANYDSFSRSTVCEPQGSSSSELARLLYTKMPMNGCGNERGLSFIKLIDRAMFVPW